MRRRLSLKSLMMEAGAYSVKQAYVKQSYFTYLPLSQNEDSMSCTYTYAASSGSAMADGKYESR
ncbi:hypothetical protein [Hungatella sp. SB206]|uniref:hypothetical protein n=1 Tax=Hungatella sp. SB206 TaxID=2937758 RepID=UPI003DA9DC54